MRIGIFTNNYLPNPYGVSTSIETFRREFEKQGPASTRGNDRSPASPNRGESTRGGHEVFIFAPYWKGYKDNNINVFRYPSIDIEIKFHFPLAIPYSWKMNKIIKNLNLDVIHAQHPNLLGSVAMKWARRKKIPLIFTWHTLYDQYTNFVPFIPAKISAGYIIKKAVKFANLADAVIVPTDSIIPILRKWGVENKNIIPIATGVLEEEFKNADRNKIREKYNIKNDEKVLLMISRLTAEKNVEFVFRSLKNILADCPLEGGQSALKIKFLVVSDGYLLPKLKEFCAGEKISDKVIFCGEVKREEIKNYYAGADIFVYGSKSETQGMIITEAMYMGLPIVAVSATGINSLVLNNGNGFLVSKNEKEFKTAVLKLITDKDLRKKFGEASSRIARMNFTASVCAKKMLEVYQKVIDVYKAKIIG
ncbi:MAG: glycosyltransferase [Parcubacteria group bacterium]|jgi:glycosyltransferase involved in cell wall biosynthesis